MNDIEGPIHRAILAYLRLRFPRGLVHHSPNAIGLSGKHVMRQIARDKQNGTVTGWPDLTICAGGRVFFVEVKGPKGYPSQAQKDVHQVLRDNGFPVCVARSVDDVVKFLEDMG